MATFLLYESASGYALFEGLDMDEIGQTAEAVQETITCVESAAPFFPLAGRNNSPIVGPRSRARAFVRPGDPNERRRDRCTVAQSDASVRRSGVLDVVADDVVRPGGESRTLSGKEACCPVYSSTWRWMACRSGAW